MFSVLFTSFRSGNILPLSLKDKEKESAGRKQIFPPGGNIQ